MEEEDEHQTAPPPIEEDEHHTAPPPVEEENHKTKHKTSKKDKAKERREKRLQEISLLRSIPYSSHQRYVRCRPFLLHFHRLVI